MDYILETSYNAFIENSKQQQLDMDRYIKECMLLSKPTKTTIHEIESLNEAAGEKIKEGFKKLGEFIKKIWAKFIEKLTRLVASDKGYLEKYKDIILKKKPLDATYTMRDYDTGIKNMINTSVPMFNYPALKEKLVDKVTFEKSIIGNYNEKVEFVDFLKDYFRGSTEDKEFKAESLNMTDIFNYCYNYNSMKDRIEKDQNTIIKASVDAGRVIDSIKPTTPTPAPATTETNAGNNTETKEESTWVYSAVYQQYITEAEVSIKKNDTGSTASGSTVTSGAGASTAAGANKNITPDTKVASADDTKAAVGEEVQDAKNRINNYMDVCKTIFTAKLTVAEEIYKGYMQIIRSHVNDHLGSDDKKQDKVAQAATDYANLSDEVKQVIDQAGGVDAVVGMEDEEFDAAVDNSGANSSIKDSAIKFHRKHKKKK